MTIQTGIQVFQAGSNYITAEQQGAVSEEAATLTAAATAEQAEVTEEIRAIQLNQARYNLNQERQLAARQAAIAESELRAMSALGSTSSGTVQQIQTGQADFAVKSAEIMSSIAGTEGIFAAQDRLTQIETELQQDIVDIEPPSEADVISGVFDKVENLGADLFGTSSVESSEEGDGIVGGILTGAAAGAVVGGPVGALFGGIVGGLWDFFD